MAQPTQTDPQFKLRLPAALKGRIQSEAAANNRSMNAEIISALEEKYPEPIPDMATVFELLEELMTQGEELRKGGERAARPMAIMERFLEATHGFDVNFSRESDHEGMVMTVRRTPKKSE